MAQTEEQIPWYKPGRGFKVTDVVKDFLILIVLTFVAGGINAVIALLEGFPELIPPQFIAYTGLFIAILHMLYTLVISYKNNL
jgi:hypothetical protein